MKVKAASQSLGTRTGPTETGHQTTPALPARPGRSCGACRDIMGEGAQAEPEREDPQVAALAAALAALPPEARERLAAALNP